MHSHGLLAKPAIMAKKWEEPPSATGTSNANSVGYVVQSALKKKENLAVVDYLLVLNKCSIERKLKTTLKLHRFIKLYTGILKITSIGILEASVT